MSGYEVQARKDGLWLITPKKDGVEEHINLLSKDHGPLKNLWQRLYTQSAPPEEE